MRKIKWCIIIIVATLFIFMLMHCSHVQIKNGMVTGYADSRAELIKSLILSCNQITDIDRPGIIGKKLELFHEYSKKYWINIVVTVIESPKPAFTIVCITSAENTIEKSLYIDYGFDDVLDKSRLEHNGEDQTQITPQQFQLMYFNLVNDIATFIYRGWFDTDEQENMVKQIAA